GQKDPLVEWQREGYDMFGQMVEAVADDFVKYVMHLDVVVEQPAAPEVSNVQYTAPDESVQTGGVAQAAARQAVETGEPVSAEAAAVEEASPVTVVKEPHEKLGRNEKCWCGSGKKFKLCHGK
ncbi:MAG: SEC-C metal-binding domain-containing protein, partial [Actinomycetota bacterium]|nr:SEC-C metal-binding domain-containing protein [Actinomycetota bacterium]